LNPIDNAQGLQRTNRPSQSIYYEIRVQGQLDSHWSDWFNGLEVTPQENGETLIAGFLPDQAALQGILTKVFNLRLLLISVKRVQPGS
jgi:hypothetical protein